MKKLVSLLSIVLFINFTVVKAQSTTNDNSNNSTVTKTGAVTADPSKDCHGVTPACPHLCTGEKASGTSSTTLSENHANTGSVSSQEAKTSMVVIDNKPSCDGKSKSCCKSVSKSSMMTKNAKVAKASAEPVSKEASTPQR